MLHLREEDYYRRIILFSTLCGEIPSYLPLEAVLSPLRGENDRLKRAGGERRDEEGDCASEGEGSNR